MYLTHRLSDKNFMQFIPVVFDITNVQAYNMDKSWERGGEMIK